MTRIGINLLWLVPGDVGGSETAAVSALRSLARINRSQAEIRLFAVRPFVDAYPDLADLFDVSVAPIDGASRAVRRMYENTWLWRMAKKHKLDLMHHLGGVQPRVSPVPTVLTIHDLQPLEFPENFGFLKRQFIRRATPRSARRAVRIGVPSAFVRTDVAARTGVPLERIDVVPWGGPPPSEVRLVPAETQRRLRQSYRLDRPFALYPAVTWPHKNHQVLIDAWARHGDGILSGMDLVLTGGDGGAEQKVRRAIAEAGLGARVHRLGRVPARDLGVLYQVAELTVFPTRYEGFGLPVLESAAHGVPIVASDIAVLDDVLPREAPRVGCDDPDGWALAIASLAADEDHGNLLVQQGRVVASRFSWDATARGWIRQYRDALAGVRTA